MGAKVKSMKSSIAVMCFLPLTLICLFSCGFSQKSSLKPDVRVGESSDVQVGESSDVRVGEGFLVKTMFVEDQDLGLVTDIVAGELDPEPGEEIGICGQNGILFVDEDGTARSWVNIDYTFAPVNLVDVEGDGVTEYMIRGSWLTPATLLDHQGKVVWTYTGESGVDDMDMGDVDGDGVGEFVVGFNGSGGVHLLDENGQRLWRRDDGNVWHVEMVDTDGDGDDEIVHSNAGGAITVRDASGNVVTSRDPGGLSGPYFSDFSIVRWPGKSGDECAILAEDDKIWLFDFDGSIIEEFDAPGCGSLGKAMAVSALLQSDQSEYLAVLVQFRLNTRSILYVYDQTAELVYHEILAETAASIADVSLTDDGTDVLLVGVEGAVWRYETGAE